MRLDETFDDLADDFVSFERFYGGTALLSRPGVAQQPLTAFKVVLARCDGDCRIGRHLRGDGRRAKVEGDLG